ncbi:hypothetical protein CHELA20_10971 [Hyphomicrobiales bacterium]|nr:hypothetical protein CHELA20_10971 [Hyphomicrobiales bacterium]CAH1694455.1 hypothetical protein CHELA41_51202 [Hyphomicrobiales bacterium]
MRISPEASRGIVGDNGLITDPAGMEPWLTDWRQRRDDNDLSHVRSLPKGACSQMCIDERRKLARWRMAGLAQP